MAWNWSTAKYDWRGFAPKRDSVVDRGEVERGIPKQRRVASDAREELPITLHFDTPAEWADFMVWFNTTIRAGQDFFNYPHPIQNVTVQARVVGGELGAREFIGSTLQRSKVTLKIEYWVSTWP